MLDPSSFHQHPTSNLHALVLSLQAAIIDGVATVDDIDGYVAAQLELARRGRLELLLDPRD